MSLQVQSPDTAGIMKTESAKKILKLLSVSHETRLLYKHHKTERGEGWGQLEENIRLWGCERGRRQKPNKRQRVESIRRNNMHDDRKITIWRTEVGIVLHGLEKSYGERQSQESSIVRCVWVTEARGHHSCREIRIPRSRPRRESRRQLQRWKDDRTFPLSAGLDLVPFLVHRRSRSPRRTVRRMLVDGSHGEPRTEGRSVCAGRSGRRQRGV